MIYIVVALGLLSAGLIFYAAMLKRQIRSIYNELPLTRKKGYNRQLTVSLMDKDLEKLTAEINKNIDCLKSLKLRSEQAELSIKQSVSDIAHDLRTPLTVIKGNLQMIESFEKLSPRGNDYLRICTEKADAMKVMADGFFELSVLESDTSETELKKINLTNLLMEFIADNEGLIRAGGITPDIVFPEKTVFCMGDRSMICRMLENLLNNVIKHAKDSFILGLSSDKNCVISFSNSINDGQEIDTEHMFDRSYRADKSRRGNGAGLGLYIVRLLAEKQQGSVSAEIKNNRLVISIFLNIE